MRILHGVLLLLPWIGVPCWAAFLRGVVVENATSRLLARTRVSLQGRGPQAVSRAATTDSAGQFSFGDLPAGTYVITAQRRGFLPARYGQFAWNAPGAPISLEANSSFMAEIRMRRLGVITGEVQDENGVGIPDVPVQAFRPGKRLRFAGSGRTDDRGVYRVAGLEPGRYLVRSAGFELEDHQGYVPTYYSQATRSQGARGVPARADDEYPGVNIQPIRGKLGRLEVEVSGPVGLRAVVSLVTDMGVRRVPLANDPIVFDALTMGSSYYLYIEGFVGDVAFSYFSRAWVGADTVKITAVVEPSPFLRVRCPGFTPGSNTVTLRRAETLDGSMLRLTCDTLIPVPLGLWELAEVSLGDQYISDIRGNTARPGSGLVEVVPRGNPVLEFQCAGPAGVVSGGEAAGSAVGGGHTGMAASHE